MKFIVASIIAPILLVLSSVAHTQELEAQGPPPREPSGGIRWEGARDYWLSHDPIADANDAIAKRDYRLFFIPVGLGTGSVTGAFCITGLSSPHVFERGMISDARGGGEQPYYEEALRAYGARYNHEIISSPDYPLSDFCRSAPALYLNDAIEATSFRPPSGPNDLSLIGAIRRGNKLQAKAFIERGEYGTHMLNLSPIAWAALIGDEEVFNYLYDNQKLRKILTLLHMDISRSMSALAAIGGNVNITRKLIADGHKISSKVNGHQYDHLVIAPIISPDMFDTIAKDIAPNYLGFLSRAIQGSNYNLAWHMLYGKFITQEDFLYSAIRHKDFPLLKKYIDINGKEEFEQWLIALNKRILQSDVINFLIDLEVSPEVMAAITSEAAPTNIAYPSGTKGITSKEYKKIFNRYGLVSNNAILAAIRAKDYIYLDQLLSSQAAQRLLTPEYKTGLYIRLLEHNQANVKALMLKFNLNIGLLLNDCCNPKLGWRTIFEFSNEADQLRLLDTIKKSTSLTNDDREKIYSRMKYSVLRNRATAFTFAYIRAMYENKPDAATLQEMQVQTKYASDDKALRLLFELGLDPNNYDSPRNIEAFDLLNLNRHMARRNNKPISKEAHRVAVLAKTKAYLDYGFDRYITSTDYGPYPMYACLKIGKEAQSFFNKNNKDCKTGLALRQLQQGIIEGDEQQVLQTLTQLDGKWAALRGWHQPIMMALIHSKLYRPLTKLARQLPRPYSWIHEKEPTKEKPFGGLVGFWRNTDINMSKSYLGLVAFALRSEDIDVIDAVLRYYSGPTKLTRSEKISKAAQFVTPKTYSLFQRALEDHQVTLKASCLRLRVVDGSQDEYLKSKDAKQLTRVLTIYLNQYRIDDVITLLSQLKDREIELGDINKRRLSSLAESIGLYELVQHIM